MTGTLVEELAGYGGGCRIRRAVAVVVKRNFATKGFPEILAEAILKTITDADMLGSSNGACYTDCNCGFGDGSP